MKKMILWAVAALFLGVVLLGNAGFTCAQDGKKIFDDKCAGCHGEKGDGKGPMAATFERKPGNLNDPKFWQGDANKKISDSITKGKDQMQPVDLKPNEIKAVTEYMRKAFKK
ncbi:MAG: cytochrome c [Deltaproteobacteria bacterium]|nr:cytochrome c [Deltaproteobacteria bacterium]